MNNWARTNEDVTAKNAQNSKKKRIFRKPNGYRISKTAPAWTLHNALCPLINTGALARCADGLKRSELFSTVCPRPEKLLKLKQLTFRSASAHLAKAAVLMRERPGLVKYQPRTAW
jgi:hypothetical protein